MNTDNKKLNKPASLVISPLTPQVPNRNTVEFAANLLRNLGPVLIIDNNNKKIEVHDPVILDLFKRMLFDLSNGRAVSIVPHNAELTTHQAAHLLNVSRPHLIKLIDEGKLECHMVGTHRRILFQNLIEFLQTKRETTKNALKNLTQYSEEHGPH